MHSKPSFQLNSTKKAMTAAAHLRPIVYMIHVTRKQVTRKLSNASVPHPLFFSFFPNVGLEDFSFLPLTARSQHSGRIKCRHTAACRALTLAVKCQIAPCPQHSPAHQWNLIKYVCFTRHKCSGRLFGANSNSIDAQASACRADGALPQQPVAGACGVIEHWNREQLGTSLRASI